MHEDIKQIWFESFWQNRSSTIDRFDSIRAENTALYKLLASTENSEKKNS